MKITHAEILSVAIPFKFTFRHALAARSAGDSVIVRLSTDDGIVGFGECAPRGYVTGETTTTVVDALRDRWLKGVIGRPFSSFDAVLGELEAAVTALPRPAHAAFCAFELALLDVAGRTFGRTAGEVLGPLLHSSVTYSGVVSSDGVEAALKTCELLRRFGVPAVKIKVGRTFQEDCHVLEGARRILGPGCSIRVDANGAWNATDALRALDAFVVHRIDAVEQPVPGDDLVGMEFLTGRSAIPIVADESLASFEDARLLAERRACHIFNVRISKCGGLMNAARIARAGAQAGIASMLGAQVGESAILSAAGRHFATRMPNLLFLEGSYGTMLLERDIAHGDLTIAPGGVGPALNGSGLSVEVDEAALAPYVIGRVEMGAR